MNNDGNYFENYASLQKIEMKFLLRLRREVLWTYILVIVQNFCEKAQEPQQVSEVNTLQRLRNMTQELKQNDHTLHFFYRGAQKMSALDLKVSSGLLRNI